MTKASPVSQGGWLQELLRKIFVPASQLVDATWAVFFIPAAILLVWVLVDWWLIRDTPEEAGFPHLDTCDASSGQMNVEFSVLDLLKKIFTSPLMLLIACVELTSGVFRYSMTQWYPTFANETYPVGAKFFTDHWGLLLCMFGIIGGFSGGLISDKMFQSRRGPPAGLLCGFVLAMAIVMSVFLFSAPKIVGLTSVCIVMASIGMTSLMSGTAATDFGGRKATATCSGIVDGFAYLGSGMQSLSLGFVVTHLGWHWWPVFLIPVALAGMFLAIKIWHDLPAATKKYIAEVERKQLSELAFD
jgi:OPA family glycerol-3-phosphate transporter-like MFS transporter